jgi:hypothetical protein
MGEGRRRIAGGGEYTNDARARLPGSRGLTQSAEKSAAGVL